MRNHRLDSTDERILRLLVRDARASYTAIGAAVGLSPNAVAQRMRRLEAAGVIRGYQAIPDPAFTSPGVGAVVVLQTTIEYSQTGIESALAAIPQVEEVLDLAGVVDYEIRLRCADNDELYRVVQRIRDLPGVAQMQTRTILREVLRRPVPKTGSLSQGDLACGEPFSRQ